MRNQLKNIYIRARCLRIERLVRNALTFDTPRSVVAIGGEVLIAEREPTVVRRETIMIPPAGNNLRDLYLLARS